MQVGFFEDMRDASEPATYEELRASLYTLSCVDDALDGCATAWSWREATSAVSRVTRFTLRRLLGEMLKRIDPPKELSEDARSVMGRDLLSLVIDLHAHSQFRAAIEACDSLWLRFTNDHDLALASLQRKGFAQRMIHQFDDAALTYDSLISFASDWHVPRMACVGHLGYAKIAIERGNLPAAKKMLSDAIAETKRNGFDDLLANALIDRAAVRGMQHDPIGAIVDNFRALETCVDPEAKDRLRYNIAMSFREAGHIPGSIEMADQVSTTATEGMMRSLASILRCNLAIDERDWRTAARIAERVLADPMPALVSTALFEARARYHATRCEFDLAAKAAEQMERIAAESGMGEVLHRASLALADIRRGVVPAIYVYRPLKTTTAAKQKLAAVVEEMSKQFAI